MSGFNVFLSKMKAQEDAWIQTYSGKQLHLLAPRHEEICLRDLAHALAMMCRYNGHIQGVIPYSVAQHCVMVSNHCNKEDALYGLLHDASEFALSDLVSPLKHSGEMENYRFYEFKLQAAIYTKFGLSENEPESVKQADKLILSTEATCLLKQPLHKDWKVPCEPLPIKIVPLMPEQAEALFLYRFSQLVSSTDYVKWLQE